MSLQSGLVLSRHFAGQAMNHWSFYALEEFLPGRFTKFDNNNGRILTTLSNSTEATNKVLAFAHYTLAKYKNKVMVCDLQWRVV